MLQAIPSHEYSADERAERARGAAIALLVITSTALAIPLTLVAVWLF